MDISTKYKAVCFDVDNTLLRTHLDYEELRMSIPRTIMGFGVDPRKFDSKGLDFVKDVSNELKNQGKDVPVRTILKKIADDMQIVEMKYAGLTEYFPGTSELLTELKARGFRLGILSNGFRGYVDRNLGTFDLAKHFDTIVAYDDLEYQDHKPEPAATRALADRMGLKPKEILYVGDSIGDYKSSVGAEAGFVAVTTGHTSREQWKEIDGNITVIDCITNLLD